MKTEMFYAKPYVDKRSRQAMADFLTAHDRHRDMYEPWKFAHDVKLWNLGIGYGIGWFEPGEDPLRDMYAELVQDDGFHADLSIMIQEWEVTHGSWKAGFEGRSGGWLALYPPDEWERWNPAEPGNYMYSEDWPLVKLRELVAIVESFDRLTDQLRDHLIWTAHNCQYIEEEEEVRYTRKVRTLVEKEVA